MTLPAGTSDVKRSKFKDAIKTIKEKELQTIIDVLASALSRLTENADRTHAVRMLLLHQEQATTDRTNTDDYFIVDPKKHKKTNLKVTAIKALKLIESDLSSKRNYEIIPITDRLLGIDADTTNLGERREMRRVVKNKIKDGYIQPYSLCLHTHSVGGQRPDFLCLFRVPGISFRVNGSDVNQFTQKFIQALNTCRVRAPVYESERSKRLAKKFLKTIIGGISNEGSKIAAADLRDIVTAGIRVLDDVDVDTLIFSSVGEGDGIISDMRKLNSRGGKGDGATMFEAFIGKCNKIVRSNAGAQERRKVDDQNKDQLFASTFISVPGLIKEVTAALQDDVKNGTIKEMPPIPSIDTISLQFVPNSKVSKTAEKMTGRINLVRHIQLRTLRNEHPDQHWVNAFTKYWKEWIVDTKNISGMNNFVCFVGQDDKAKVSVGDTVAVSTEVRAKHKGLVNTDDSLNQNKACDHDFTCSNIIPSVTLFGNIPDEIDGSFFGGGADGDGEIRVVLRDAVFDPSNVFCHSAQLVAAMEDRYPDTKPAVLLLQTDGGPDHNITFLKTRLALLATFVKLDLDHFVAIRGAPHGSWLNTVERAMSILNLGLMNVALKRGVMSGWAEREVRGIGSMKGIREKYEDLVRLNCSKKRSLKRADVQKDRDEVAQILLKLPDPSSTEKYNKSADNEEQIQSSSLECTQPQAEKDMNSCSYLSINSCCFSNTTIVTPRLDTCYSCNKLLHHLCQVEFANKNKFEENEMKKACHKCLHKVYNVGGLAATSNNAFGAHTVRAKILDANRQEDMPCRADAHITTEQFKKAKAQAATDPKQSKLNNFFVSPAKVDPKSSDDQNDLREEWRKAMNVPIQQIASRFKYLDIGGRPVVVDEKCTDDDVGSLHSILKKIDQQYNPEIRSTSQLRKMPKLQTFMNEHFVITPYSLSIQKCGKSTCSICKPIRSPEGDVREIVMQRQPTPKKDTARRGHYLTRQKALAEFKDDLDNTSKMKRLTDTSCLPSKVTHKLPPQKRKVDVDNGRPLKSWDASYVRQSVDCEECARPRCIFAKSILTKDEVMQFQSHIENTQFICGNPLFQEGTSNNSLADILKNRVNLNCFSPVETEYYNPVGTNKRSAFRTEDICAHCCAPPSAFVDVYLEKDIKLQKLASTEGKSCLPICKDCLNDGLRPVLFGRAKTMIAAKERRDDRQRQQKAKRKNSSSKSKDGKSKSKPN